MNILYYFWLFLKASLFSTGGLGNLPFLHTDLIQLGWAQEEDFLTALAVGQVSPGPNGIWSVSLGYLTLGWLGAGLAVLALLLPTVLVVVLASVYERMGHLNGVRFFSFGLSLGVVGMSFYIAYMLSKTAITDWIGVVVVLASLGMMLSRRVPVIVILLAAALAGVFIYC